MRITDSENIARQVKGENVTVEYNGKKKNKKDGLFYSVFTFTIECDIRPCSRVKAKKRDNIYYKVSCLLSESSRVFVGFESNPKSFYNLVGDFGAFAGDFGAISFEFDEVISTVGKLVVKCRYKKFPNPDEFVEIFNTKNFHCSTYTSYIDQSYNLEIYEDNEQ